MRCIAALLLGCQLALAPTAWSAVQEGQAILAIGATVLPSRCTVGLHTPTPAGSAAFAHCEKGADALSPATLGLAPGGVGGPGDAEVAQAIVVY